MEKQKFEIKPEHLKLMKRFIVGWSECEFGAPEIDPKRPYGDSSVEQSMVNILGYKTVKEGKVWSFELNGKEYTLTGEDEHNFYFENDEELLNELVKLHRETEQALQICLSVQSFEIGIYEAEECSFNWKKVGESRNGR